MLRYFFCAVLSLICAGAAQADEGMWTLDSFPSESVAKAYGFKPDAAWLEHAKLSAVRLAGGCSGSFVSPQGLVQTNHHCAHACIEQLSTPQKDFVASGFYAARLEDEIKCPQIEINQLTDIANVTDRVQAAIKGLQGKAFADARKAIEAKIAKECVGTQADSLRCDVVELYHGGVYDLYKYRRYQDVRLVFAPEIAIAFFGGDPDNFEFPRYDLDVSYLRVYDRDRPLDTARFHFKYAQTDVRPGDLTFVLGNPGSTNRLDTVAQLETQRDVDLPRILLYLSEYRGQLIQFMKRGPEQRRIAEDTLFGVENSVKALRGRFEALVDPTIIKARAKMQKAIAPKLKGDPFQRIAEAEVEYRNIRDRLFMIESNRGFASTLFTRAKGLVRYAAESRKPDGERLREYTEANFPSLRQSLLSTAPVYPELETMKLGFSLTKLRETLGPDDPLVRKVFGHSSADEIAQALVQGSKMADLDARKALLAGGEAAIEASDDSMIRLVREIDPDMRAVRKTYEDEVQSVLERNSSAIADALFATYGTSVYPDATFTLRLSYGSVKGYPEKGREIDPITRMAGLFQRANGPVSPNVPDDPFRLPQRWLDAKSALDPNQPFDFATTNDIIGGNSGSPVINSNSEIVGLIFDGNIESLGGDFGYDGRVNRAVAVAVGALREALIKVYHADRIAEELKS